MIKTVLSVILLIFLCWSGLSGQQQNIALGKTATYQPATNYHLCTDPGDPFQLTDGIFAGEGFWTDKNAVGWNYAAPYSLTIDLGSIEPVSGVMYSTASRGNAGVFWPTYILVLVSDDGSNFRYVGDLVAMDRANGIPEFSQDKENRHKYRTNSLQTHGRYVKIAVTSPGACVFIDEIEIYRGDEAFLTNPRNEENIADIKQFIEGRMVMCKVLERLEKDITDIRKRIAGSSIKQSDKFALSTRLDKYRSQIDTLPIPDSNKFRSVLPLNDLHAKIYTVNAALLKLQKYPELKLWKKHRYDLLTQMEKPRTTKPVINIDALGSEYRADSFVVTNASQKAISATLKISGIKGVDEPEWVEVSCVPWTDTSYLQPVSSALPSIKPSAKAYNITLPSGINTLIWFTVNTSKIKPGSHKGYITLSYSGKTHKVPFNIKVSKIKMPRPRISLGMWDYTHANGDRALVPGNMDAARKLMKSHYVDSPWAQMDALPIAENIPDSSFEVLDKWIKNWPDARNYMVNGGFPHDKFLGADFGSPEFYEKVGKWAKEIDTHLESTGVDPKKLTLLVQDEPGNDETDEFIATYIKAIKSKGSRISIFQDPIWEHPENARIQEAITLCDILCPNMSVYYRGGESVRQYWEKIRDTGHNLWFYQCSGPVRTFSPTKYYRMMAWHAFKAGFVGLGFWSFGDLGGGRSSWNEYAIAATIYAPAYIDPESVTDSVHWQSVREGIQDYESLALLDDAIKKSNNTRLKTEARNLLNTVVADVTSDTSADYTWKSDSSHVLVDTSRVKVLRMLERLQTAK